MAWVRGKVLGAGAFGSVNLAMKRESGEVFAVKSVAVSARDAVAVSAIENEIEILQGLDSRYVVRCSGSDWTEEGGILMRNAFLEYMPEGCLIDFVKQFASSGALDEHLLRTYTRSIVEGIDYLHSQGIVHCDIKGKNVLVGNGAVKLTDFGSSKRVVAETASVNCGAKVNGTPMWMAPEVVRQVEQGLASDIWSLGCTVVEMASGRAPWSNFANHFVALYHIGCTDELPEVPAALSAEAHDFLSHCFQRDPCKRWTSAQLLQHPFITSRFVAPAVQQPCAAKAPASPVSVMHFPADSDSDTSFVHSVPTLAAPSLFKRGLVCAQPKVQEQVEDNWWTTPDSPDSGPWIVVKSPKSPPPSYVVPDAETPSIERDECAATVESECTTAASPVLNASDSSETCSASDADDIEIVAKDAPVPCLPLKPTDRVAGSGNHGISLPREEFSWSSDGASSTSLNFGRTDCTSEYSEQETVYSFSNPQILLHWLHRTVSRDFECLKSGHSNHCMLLLDKHRIAPVQVQTICCRICPCLVFWLISQFWLMSHFLAYVSFFGVCLIFWLMTHFLAYISFFVCVYVFETVLDCWELQIPTALRMLL